MTHPLFRQRPWLTQSHRLSNEPVGMLGHREAMFFYDLARDYFQGTGTIIDAGSFLGKSACFFAEGLRANPNHDATRDRIHCFDNFLVNEETTADFIRTKLAKSLQVGDSTREIFEQQVRAVRNLLEVHAGDFHLVSWAPQPIEVLMVDIAKSKSLCGRVIEIFFPGLIPGLSVVVHQDYHHPWLPHIHVLMEYLSDYFQLVVPRVDDSAGFLCIREIPGEVLSRAVTYNFSLDEQLELMDSALNRLPAGDRHYVELARLILRSKKDDARKQRADHGEIAKRHQTEKLEDPQWSNYLEGVRDSIDEQDGWRQKELGNFSETLQLANGLISRGRENTHILVMRAIGLIGLGDIAEAEGALRAALQPPIRSGYAYVELGNLLLGQGRIDEAEIVVVKGVLDRAAVGADRQHFAKHLGDLLFHVWTANPRRERIQAVMQQLRAELSDEPEIWFLDARVSLLDGDREAAMLSLRKAEELGLTAERCVEVNSRLQPQ